MIKKIFVFIICIILIAVAALFIYKYINDQDKKDNKIKQNEIKEETKKETQERNIESAEGTQSQTEEQNKEYDYMNPSEKPGGKVVQEDKAAGDSYAENQKMTD